MRCSVIRPNGLEGPGEVNPSNKISNRNGDAGAAVANKENEMNSLEESMRKMSLGRNVNGKKKTISKVISKLEVKRLQSADEKRHARKAAWIAETQPEVEKLAKFWKSNASKLLPVPLWKRILGQVEDLKEKAMLSNMSPIWRDALEDDRNTFLFHEVFPILNNTGYLPKQDMLACRHVCREWNRSIMYWQQAPNIFPPLSLLEVYRVRIPKQLIRYNQVPLDFLGDSAEVTNFLKWSKRNCPSRGNPFFGRKLRVGCIGPHDPQANSLFWAEIKRLFAKWGREVWSVQFIFTNLRTVDSAGLYELACTLLRYTPNLRLLSFISQYLMEDTDKLKSNIRKLSLPELVHLDTILVCSIPSAMMKSMLTKFGSTLNHVITFGKQPNLFASGGIPLPNLTKLHFTSSKPEEFKFCLDSPFIEELDIQFEKFIPAKFPELFQSINALWRTLRKLHLKLEHNFEEPVEGGLLTTKKLMLTLPNLEQFSFGIAVPKGVNLKNIDFILPMVSLKDLTICYIKFKKPVTVAGPPNPLKAPGEDMIKFWDYVHRLYDSNIWRLLPELRRVTIISFKTQDRLSKTEINFNQNWNIKEKVYTREGYLEHVGSK